ncbi:hypothetical protein RFM41_30330 [Mesorhizobium sp. VK25A]|uniref:Uncharacterized protein n=2 Tax=Mesorhizobium TaxID=68287 RepID=A0ABU5ACD4_9HYPH|nr:MULTISPECIES: hypothetical protein [unclassified Mesorhizobium]MDX8527981.1 hypothetical protein [Mesorhizobium sp. MSK_1335]MDX8535262.1 hypothetical protein [Mesorhizobium sp. VK25D]MDX8548067.1 hypothetical protein [Mesorhizobium sp. VK25A]
MIPFDEKKLDEWLADYESFNYAFREFCYANFKVHGLEAHFIPNVTKQIHAQWVADNQQWLSEETSEKTTRLSHVKICALLLFNLNSEPFLGNFFDHEYNEDVPYDFKGSDEQKATARQDLIDGRESILALDFCLLIINWFERNRTDRAIPYRQPMTADMRHDLLNYLLGGAVDRKGLYLILKAMYLRPNRGGAAN